jgi:hypothetical protein
LLSILVGSGEENSAVTDPGNVTAISIVVSRKELNF